MLKTLLKVVIVGVFMAGLASSGQAQEKVRRLSVKTYLDKMKGGWLGQMAGVGWGAPTEFRWRAAMIPADRCRPGTPA